jgi:aspartyl-tRNA(Asn)/glutamyl-tRNA(Gln) amidotransferase subunit A
VATSESLTLGCLERIDRLGGELAAFATVQADTAVAAAKQADGELRAGVDRGPLHGIPVAVKDILATADAPTSAGSRAFDGREYEGRDAAAVAALRGAGAVIVGKTALSELAIGLPEAHGPFPPPRNPWDLSRWAGGSSAGTASGLAAGLFLAGLGTDTGGSIRIPAAFCGVTGLKPSRGLVPATGVVPLAPTLDTVGPMAGSARDCALVLEVLAGAGFLDESSLAGLRVGIDRRHERVTGVAPEAAGVFEEAVAVFDVGGALLSEVTVPGYDLAADATTVVIATEALATHRAGLRERWSEYGRSTRLRIAAGAFYTDADRARARAALDAVAVDVAALFEHVDVLLTLTAGTGAWPLVDLALDAPSRSPFFTRVWSGLGFPALSVPAGFDASGLPIGLQIVGPPGGDAAVLGAGAAFQSVTDWHLRRPDHANQRRVDSPSDAGPP